MSISWPFLLARKQADGMVGCGATAELIANPVLRFRGIKKADDTAANSPSGSVMSQA